MPRTWINEAVARLGWPGIIGTALLVGAAGFYLTSLAPEQARLANLKDELAQLRERALHPRDETYRSPAEMLSAFYQYFPPSTRLPAVLAGIFDAAKQQSLALEQGEYRVATTRVGKLIQYQITLPVRGSYPQIRKFVDAALGGEPGLSLESVHFERQKIEEPMIEAKIKLIMYLGEER
jgi:Tfp pilus assembly protein PilO